MTINKRVKMTRPPGLHISIGRHRPEYFIVDNDQERKDAGAAMAQKGIAFAPIHRWDGKRWTGIGKAFYQQIKEPAQ